MLGRLEMDAICCLDQRNVIIDTEAGEGRSPVFELPPLAHDIDTDQLLAFDDKIGRRQFFFVKR